MSKLEVNPFDAIKPPTADEMGLSVEFVYAAKIVKILSQINFEKDCEKNEAIRAIEKAFHEYKDKILKK